MNEQKPVSFQLKDGTHVDVYEAEPHLFEFYLTRLNSEKHNFFWNETTGHIEESYETRFDAWQEEAVALFRHLRTA